MRRSLVAAAVLALGLAGCGGAKQAQRAPADTIEIFGPYRGVEADRFDDALAPFRDRTGIPVRYVGSVDFVADLQERAGEGNNPPDVAVVPQPGLMRELADDHAIVPVSEATRAALQRNYRAQGAGANFARGQTYGVPFRVLLKSLVWYRPSVFKARGWTVPQTLDDLTSLVNRIQSTSGVAPWCFSMASGSATGWAATDWVEDLVLRRQGPQVYRGWVNGKVPFADPRIEAAFEEFRTLVLERGRVAGGLSTVLERPVSEAIRPMFDDEPGCALYKQADIATGWLPDGIEVGPGKDVQTFQLPPAQRGSPAPLLIGGDQIVQFRRSRDVDALMTYLAGPTAGETWTEAGGFLSPKTSIASDRYPDQYRRQLARQFASVSTLAFDGSDQMPPAVGGLFWRDITAWVAGTTEYDDLAKSLDTAMKAAEK